MEVYGVNLYAAMEGGYEPSFVAALATQLPMDCRWRISYDQDALWTFDRLLYAGIINNLRGLIWGLADKKKRGPEPVPIGPSWAKQAGRRLQATVMSRDELLVALRKPRREE